MAKTIWLVFKIIGLSIILMVVMDISLMVMDYVTINSRINAIANDMRTELRENNCIPDSIAPAFDEELKKVGERSLLVPHESDAITWNWKTDITNSQTGQTFNAVSESNVVDYGETLDLIILVKVKPHSILFTSGDKKHTNIVKQTNDRFVFKLPYITSTFALRYLK